MMKTNILHMVTINISLNDELAEVVDREMKEKKYANRSEFFRDLIRRQYVLKASIGPNTDYYKTLDQSMKDWAGPENDDIFVINKK